MKKTKKKWALLPVEPQYHQLIKIEAAKRNMRISDLIAEYIMKNNSLKNAYCPACELVNEFTINEDGSYSCSLCGLGYDTIDSKIAYNYN